MIGKLSRGVLSAGLMLALCGCSKLELLNPKGDIGAQERTLILLALGVMLLVVIPVIVLTLVFRLALSRVEHQGDLRAELGAFDRHRGRRLVDPLRHRGVPGRPDLGKHPLARSLQAAAV